MEIFISIPSKKGEKVEDIRRGSPVCFEVDDPSPIGAAGREGVQSWLFIIEVSSLKERLPS